MESVQITENEILKMFQDFNANMRKKTFRTVLRQSSNILRKQAILNLKHYVSNIDRKDKWGNTLRKGIVTKIAKNLKSATVHILANFKLKFFEMGTNVRYNKRIHTIKLKKRRYTGSINATHFFTTAKKQTETTVFNSIRTNLEATIRKINEKHK
ncbi:hypothetical protein [Phocaeicola barnesiae]|uniref:HK97 gp10 family phage protein n=1 Tax=Phocaeicola barnesiae TaxID=376804 RepID=A0AAW5N7D4_9BACT|nr:hypothetical protein [Phocaeicola barnesiae]MCR8874888.1 hypothetical protein [Phocaeicola barnesiae]